MACMANTTKHKMLFTNLIILVINVQVKSDWVEISQQHYRKRVKPHHFSEISNRENTPFTEGTIIDQDLNIHDNSSIRDSWIKGNVYRVQNIGSVKRIKDLINTEHITIEKQDDLKVDVEEKYGVNVSVQKHVVNQLKEELKLSDTDKKIVDSEMEKYLKDENDPIDNSKKIVNNKSESPTDNNKMENIFKFLKVVTDTISQNTGRGFKSKLNYLRELQNSILMNIGETMDATWPDDDLDGNHRTQSQGANSRRKSRSAPAHGARGHVDFPSSESALMTISFLTFAVFLIKLVLQVIQTYKNKTMMVAPAVFAVSRGARRDET